MNARPSYVPSYNYDEDYDSRQRTSITHGYDHLSTHRQIQACNNSLRDTLTSLKSSVKTLDSATTDFPRLQRVLQLEKGFDVINETEALNARDALAKEYVPKINELLDEYENEIKRCKEKERRLKAKTDLMSLHYSDEISDDTLTVGAASMANTTTVDMITPQQISKLKKLEAERDNLAYQLSFVEFNRNKLRKSLGPSSFST
ncbi:hypothetical protein NADFUDRAFT_45238 [Nadsonia fulvescens var. elongata DSM 6958]|uniref:DASH complex subunit SPC19 n=1 Tax=Nadsonia fulvescens var. elongata DSM 6958 TaxID=857566 RepID=A0A1E3PP39_9ASCO|nr:hypothetical protein NADFUDRAFT_45238 [Nadsonia fulvescens var. elongata DSM 6958]